MPGINSYAFDCTGVAVIPTSISRGDVLDARAAIKANWPEGTPWKFPVMHLSRIFWSFMTHPLLLDLAEEFAGDNFRLDHAFGVSSNGAPAQMHGGPQSSQHSCFYHPISHGGRQGIAGQLNFGFTLHGQSPETGGFCYIPGSHKQTDPRAGQEILEQVYKGNFDHPSIVVPTLNAGDMLLFTEGLVHGDTGWKDPNTQRMQIYYKITPGFMCWRDPAQSDQLWRHAQTELERNMVQPPWTGRYTEDEKAMGITNERREPTRRRK